MLAKKIECRPVWKPMHKQPVYEGAPVYTNGVEEDLFKVGFCLPAGPYVTDEDVRYIVECIKEAIRQCPRFRTCPRGCEHSKTKCAAWTVGEG